LVKNERPEARIAGADCDLPRPHLRRPAGRVGDQALADALTLPAWGDGDVLDLRRIRTGL